jgi:urea transporter
MHVTELLARFFIGGLVVSFFAVLAEVFRPKSFAGLFGAAPSVALATLAISLARHGRAYAAVEAKFMVFGALAFCGYALAVSWILRRYKPPALTATISLMPVWFAASFGLWFVAR